MVVLLYSFLGVFFSASCLPRPRGTVPSSFTRQIFVVQLCRRTPHATTKTLHKCFSLALMICRQKSMKTRGANATWNKKWSKSGGKTKKKCKLRRYCGFQRLLLQAQHFCIWAVSRYWIAILEWCCSKFNLNACLITMTFYNLQKGSLNAAINKSGVLLVTKETMAWNRLFIVVPIPAVSLQVPHSLGIYSCSTHTESGENRRNKA